MDIDQFRAESAEALGVQILADLHGCDRGVLDDVDRVRSLMIEAARRCGATIVEQCFHRFNPHGVSGVVVISESHLAIHTWPEHGYVALDLFTCGHAIDPNVCVAFLRDGFRSQSGTTRTVLRGSSPSRLGGS